MTHAELLTEIDSLSDSCSVSGRLATSLRAVVELHKPGLSKYRVKIVDVCLRCDATYPCPTIKAIMKEFK